MSYSFNTLIQRCQGKKKTIIKTFWFGKEITQTLGGITEILALLCSELSLKAEGARFVLLGVKFAVWNK